MADAGEDGCKLSYEYHSRLLTFHFFCSLYPGFFKGTSTDQDRRFSDKERKLLKSLKAPRGAQADLWVRMVGGAHSRIGEPDGSDEGREIGWWLEEGSEVMLCLQT